MTYIVIGIFILVGICVRIISGIKTQHKTDHVVPQTLNLPTLPPKYFWRVCEWRASIDQVQIRRKTFLSSRNVCDSLVSFYQTNVNRDRVGINDPKSIIEATALHVYHEFSTGEPQYMSPKIKVSYVKIPGGVNLLEFEAGFNDEYSLYRGDHK